MAIPLFGYAGEDTRRVSLRFPEPHRNIHMVGMWYILALKSSLLSSVIFSNNSQITSLLTSYNHFLIFLLIHHATHQPFPRSYGQCCPCCTWAHGSRSCRWVWTTLWCMLPNPNLLNPQWTTSLTCKRLVKERVAKSEMRSCRCKSYVL